MGGQVTDSEELLALLAKLTPYEAVVPHDEMAVLAMHQQVFAARRAIAEQHGSSVAELLRLEVQATSLGRLR